MPFTQDRLRAILLEYSKWVESVTNLLTNTDQALGQSCDAADKLRSIAFDIDSLRGIPRTRLDIEMDALNRNWKRNQRQAAKMERKRRAAGIAPREPTGIESDYLPRGQLAAFTTGEQADDIYTGPPSTISPDMIRHYLHDTETDEQEPKNATVSSLDPFAPISARERAQCKAEMEMDEEPSDGVVRSWREGHNGPRKITSAGMWDSAENNGQD